MLLPSHHVSRPILSIPPRPPPPRSTMSNPTLGVLGDVELVHSFLEAVNTNLFMFVHDLTDLFPEEWTSVCQTYTTVAFLYKDADIDGIVQAQKFIAHHRISDGTSSVFLVPMVSSVHLRSTLIQEVPISQSSPQYAQVLNFIRAWRLPPTPPYFPPPPPPHQQSRPGTPKKAPKKKSQGTLRIQNSTAEMITESRTHQLGRQWIDLLPRLKVQKTDCLSARADMSRPTKSITRISLQNCSLPS